MTIDEAHRYSKKAVVGDVVAIQLETKQFGRIAAQTAKHVIRQGIREAERGQQMQEFQRRNQGWSRRMSPASTPRPVPPRWRSAKPKPFFL